LAPLTKAHRDAPGPTLWADVRQSKIGGVISVREAASQDTFARVEIRIHASLFVWTKIEHTSTLLP
jgi:hypothetical protein